MRTILIAVIVLAIVAVLIVDGLGMYAAHRIVVEVAEGAAEQAAQVYVATDGSERAAQIASEADVQLVSADYHAATTRWYQVTMRAQPDVFFLDHLPYVRDLLAQESTATVHF
jgi:type II secretory pathway pseudopilin PulG